MEKEKKVESKSGLVLCIIIMAAVVAIISTVVALIKWGGKSSSETAENTAESTENTETKVEVLANSALSAGTVTTTIDGKSITYNAAYVVDGVEATIGSGTYESAADDEVVFLVINGGKLTIQGEEINIRKTGTVSGGRGDDYSFYGTNSAVVVAGEGSEVFLYGANITTNAGGANAVVATNSGSAEVRHSTIKTSTDSSRGLHATYKGSIEASDVEISTQGQSCASLATDRGEGTVSATNMTLSTAGAGSPLIYSTGEITVASSKGTATGSQIAVVEGKNSITLNGDEFSANAIGNRNNADNAGVMIYQSMSGDAGEGLGTFAAKDTALKILDTSSVYASAPMFFVTNTTANISLTNVKLGFGARFISAKGTSEWGRSGSNGGKVTYSLSGTDVDTANIEVDSISSVTQK